MRFLSPLARFLGKTLLLLVILLCLAISIVPPYLDHLYYRGAVSDHFDGQRFFNPDGSAGFVAPSGAARRSFVTRLLGGGDLPSWPSHVAVTPAHPPARVTGSEMRVTWVGHASVLVQASGVNILTDPVWSDVVSPFPPLGPRRVAEPGIRFQDLPPIDIVVISHNHYDHFDVPTLRRLWRRDRPLIAVPLGNDTLLKEQGVEAVGLDWGQSLVRRGVTLTAVRNHHWDSRWGVDRNRALWSAWVVRTGAGNLWFGGDTGPGDMHWASEATRYGPFRLALIPIGGFRFGPGEMANANHIGPMQAVQIFRDLGAATAMPMHWGTFRLSSEGYWTGPRMVDLFMRCAGIDPAHFRARRIGESWDVPSYAPQRAGKPMVDPAQCRPGSAALAALK